MTSATIVTRLRDAFATPGHEAALLWKNAEHSAYRTLVSGGNINEFSLSSSGLCCFDVCLFAGFSYGDLSKDQLRQIYKTIVAGGYNDMKPLIHGSAKTVSHTDIGGPRMGSDVVNRWPLAGELVFFNKTRVGALAHVAYALDANGKVVSFGHKVPEDAQLGGHSQQYLNEHGLMQSVEVKEIKDIWPIFQSLVYCASPAWDP